MEFTKKGNLKGHNCKLIIDLILFCISSFRQANYNLKCTFSKCISERLSSPLSEVEVEAGARETDHKGKVGLNQARRQ